MRQAAGRRPGEQPEREQRRDSDESEKSEGIWTQQETEGRSGTEEREADGEAESAAAASFEVLIGEDIGGSLPPKPRPPIWPQPGPARSSPVQPSPAPEERIFFLPGLSVLWDAHGAWVGRAPVGRKICGTCLIKIALRLGNAASGAKAPRLRGLTAGLKPRPSGLTTYEMGSNEKERR